MEFVIGVIDIGMTNKKIALYDSALKQIDISIRNFPPKIIDGFETHDLEAMEEWLILKLRDYSKKYPVKALSVSAHGGTFTCLDKAGRLTVPCIYYTHERGDEFHKKFYEKFGSPCDLQIQPGTPALTAFLNAAKGLFFVKENYPEDFKKTSLLLLYPQYWAYRFTGKAGLENTYLGCHTYLWDQLKSRFSSVAEGLEITHLFPHKISKSWEPLGKISKEFADKTGLDNDTIVTMGIHDSNSSLLPHFAKKGETGFILNSTGTWCVLMNPVNEYNYSQDEIGKTVFYNISANGKPIKTAIFQGGQEFETWSQLFMDFHKKTEIPSCNKDIYRSVLIEKDAFLLPELFSGSGQFPYSKARITEKGKEYFYKDILRAVKNNDHFCLPECFFNYEKVFVLLKFSLIMQTIVCLERIGIKPGMEIFVEGGFRKDIAYNTYLSAFFPDNDVFLSDIEEVTAFGVAMTAKMALTGKQLMTLSEDFEIDYQIVEKESVPELFSYRDAWMKYAENIGMEC